MQGIACPTRSFSAFIFIYLCTLMYANGKAYREKCNFFLRIESGILSQPTNSTKHKGIEVAMLRTFCNPLYLVYFTLLSERGLRHDTTPAINETNRREIQPTHNYDSGKPGILQRDGVSRFTGCFKIFYQVYKVQQFTQLNVY